MKVVVKRGFEDLVEKVDRKPGETFTCSKERGEEIFAILGEEFVELVQEQRARKAKE